jgi:Rrf2 family protein
VADFVRMSEATALGLHAAVLAAREQEAITVSTIAAKLSASEAHLSKILQTLAKSGLLESRRGPNGGYVLTKPASEVTLLEVYEVFEGPIRSDGCLFSEPVCHRVQCIFGDVVGRLRAEICETMRSTTLEQASSEQWR